MFEDFDFNGDEFSGMFGDGVEYSIGADVVLYQYCHQNDDTNTVYDEDKGLICELVEESGYYDEARGEYFVNNRAICEDVITYVSKKSESFESTLMFLFEHNIELFQLERQPTFQQTADEAYFARR